MSKITSEQAKVIGNINSSLNDKTIDFDEEYESQFDNILERILEQMRIVIQKSGKTTQKVFEETYNMPMSINSWHKYTSKKLETMQLKTFYKICRYTGVSADYLLCFNDVPNKKASAEQIQEDYGLTLESLDSIEEINQRTKRFVEQGLTFDKGYATEYDFLNFLITTFAPQFLVSVYHYFYVLDEYEKFEKEHFNVKRKLKKKFLSNDEQRIIDEYQEVVTKVDTEKFILMQKVYRLVDEFREDLKKAPHNIKGEHSNKQKATD